MQSHCHGRLTRLIVIPSHLPMKTKLSNWTVPRWDELSRRTTWPGLVSLKGPVGLYGGKKVKHWNSRKRLHHLTRLTFPEVKELENWITMTAKVRLKYRARCHVFERYAYHDGVIWHKFQAKAQYTCGDTIDSLKFLWRVYNGVTLLTHGSIRVWTHLGLTNHCHLFP